MNKAKKYYVDKDGNMIGYPRHHRNDKTEMLPEVFYGKLKIIGIGWLNSGFYLSLQDENGKVYNMNNIMFKEYVKQNDVYIEGDWDFYQQGTAYSIGLLEV